MLKTTCNEGQFGAKVEKLCKERGFDAQDSHVQGANNALTASAGAANGCLHQQYLRRLPLFSNNTTNDPFLVRAQSGGITPGWARPPLLGVLCLP